MVERNNKRIAAIDVGSNAIRILIVEHSNGKHSKQIHKQRFPVRLGQSVFDSGKVDPATITLAMHAFQECQQIGKKHNVSHARAVGTNALRNAANAKIFCDSAQEILGFPLEVIDG